jgi:transcriptional regulator with GAF, ATPase, and Fis domain
MSDEIEWEDGPVITYPPIMKDKRRGLAAVPGSPIIGSSSPESDSLTAAIGRIARIVSGTLELKEVFAQVAEVAGEVVPFEAMGVCRVAGPNILQLYAVAGDVGEDCKEGDEVSFEDFSPAIRPGQMVTRRMDDAQAALDRTFPMDREILDGGDRALLCAPLLVGKRHAGQVWFTSSQPGVFTEIHERTVTAIADILSLSLEHERLFTLDAARRRRIDAIDTLLPALARTLDLRGIFDHVSEIANPVLPHDKLILTSLSEDGREMVVEAMSGEPLAKMPPRFKAGRGDCTTMPEYVLIPDTAEQQAACGARDAAELIGMRSFLGIPMHLDTGTSWLMIVSRTPNQYSEEDVVVGRRLADHVALALSHQRLAGEERRAAEARERANRLEERVQVLRDQLETTLGYRRVIGEAKPWKAVLSQAAKVAQTETTVLLTGESGTGKEVVARFIHRGSPRHDGPFAALNCAALPDTLLESELFGHERGAFTGATTSRPGRIEQAAGGVLFLDEVAEMTPAVQAKLLRVLQEREFQRLGGTRSLRADVRIIAATNKDLEGMIASGAFREDLYYRLRVFEIGLPALRERQPDILPMADAFLDEIGALIGRKAAGISRDAAVALQSYHWPGNVRELRNALERATILCDGGLITLEHLPFSVGRSNGRSNGRGSGKTDGAAGRPMLTAAEGFPNDAVKLKDVERDLILRALHESGNNRSKAARLLGITRSQLYTKLQRHNIEA